MFSWNCAFANANAGSAGDCGFYVVDDGNANFGHFDFETQLALWRTGSDFFDRFGGPGAFVWGSFTAMSDAGQMNYSGVHNRLCVGGEVGSHTIGSEGNIGPETDDAYSLGTSGLRFSTVFATTGAINTSDQRLKTDITDCPLGLDFVQRLKPRAYRWIEGGKDTTFSGGGRDEKGRPISSTKTTITRPGQRIHHGLIAQEVKAALDEVGAGDFAGWVLENKDEPGSKQSLRYDQFIAPLINAVQQLAARVEVLEQELAEPRGQ